MQNLMYGTNYLTCLLAIMCILLVSGCEEDKKDDKPDENTPVSGIQFTTQGTLKMQFTHVYNDSNLQLAPKTYITNANDTVAFTDIKYYVSHVSLTRADNSVLNLQNNNLVDIVTGKTEIDLSVPAGIYKSISFILGVDSANNTGGLQQGDLDPANGMFWTWSTGYIFYRIKGRHGAANTGIVYDIGGTQHLQHMSFDLSTYAIRNSAIRVVVEQDLAKFFNIPNQLQLKTMANQIHSATHPLIPTIKENMSGMFRILQIN